MQYLNNTFNKLNDNKKLDVSKEIIKYLNTINDKIINNLNGNKITSYEKNDIVTENFKNKYDVDNMPNIENIKVIARYRYSDNLRDEYSSFHSGELELSYDYVKSNNNVINVIYKANYNSTQTYENRYNPYVEFDSSLKVSPTLNYTYNKDEEIIYDDEEEDKWCDLMNKVLDDILCEADNFSDIVISITENGKYSSED